MYYRHNRVWLSEAGWERARATAPGNYASAFALWAENDWPAIVRRADPESDQSTICLGLPLAPDARTGIKIRIPFAAFVDDIARHDAPLDIIEAGSALPTRWHAEFFELSEAVIIRQLEFRVYGSAAMQAMTGAPYLTASSDIDLLFYPGTKAQLQEGLNLLAGYSERLPLDGEIIFPSGRAVSWKEWAQAAKAPGDIRLLAKSMYSLNLVRAADLLVELQ